MATWGYAKHNGPRHWHDSFPIASEGVRQSPINVDTNEVVVDNTLGPLSITYAPQNNKYVENNGHSFKVNVDGSGSELSGGPLDGSYELWQYHAHWGSKDSKGSEHTVDGEEYAGELHLVHWNRSKYSSPDEATEHPDGLAVLGVFIKAGDETHGEFDKLITLLPSIRRKGTKADMSEVSLDPAKLLPEEEERYYWTYPGSLTTPPLSECVVWILFKKPITLGEDQIKELRRLTTIGGDEGNEEEEEDVCMVNNFRPPVEIGDRVVRTNDS